MSAPTTARRALSGGRAPPACDRQRLLVWAPSWSTGGEPSADTGRRPGSARQAMRVHRVANLHRAQVRAPAWSAAGRAASHAVQIAGRGRPLGDQGAQQHSQQPLTGAPQGEPNQHGDVSAEQRRVHGRYGPDQEPPTDRCGDDHQSGEHQRKRELDSVVQDGSMQVQGTIAEQVPGGFSAADSRPVASVG